MNTQNQLKKDVIFLMLIVILPFINAFSQTDDLSNGAYTQIYISKFLNKVDKNNDNIFSKSEDERIWQRHKYLDVDKNDELNQEELSKIEISYLNVGGKRKLNVLYKKTKEEDLYLDIYYPKNRKESQKLPVVIYTHGGGWAVGSKQGAAVASFKSVHSQLLEKGFCIVSVSYRLWSKNGTTAMRDCVIDSKDALRYLSKNSEKLGVDTKRFFSFGDSAGGQISQMLLLSPPETLIGDSDLESYTYKMVAGVSWYGPCDFEKTSLFNHDNRANFRDRFGPRILKPDTNPKDKMALYREMSPINYLNNDSAPLLMIQGDSDTTIPVKHVYYMEEKVKKIGAPVTTIIIKNAGHNWRKVGGDIDPSREWIIQKTVDYFVSNL